MIQFVVRGEVFNIYQNTVGQARMCVSDKIK